MKIARRPEAFDEYPGSGHWLLATESKILGMHRRIGSPGACNRKLVAQI
jgi:hypothetical protein